MWAFKRASCLQPDALRLDWSCGVVVAIEHRPMEGYQSDLLGKCLACALEYCHAYVRCSVERVGSLVAVVILVAVECSREACLGASYIYDLITLEELLCEHETRHSHSLRQHSSACHAFTNHTRAWFVNSFVLSHTIFGVPSHTISSACCSFGGN